MDYRFTALASLLLAGTLSSSEVAGQVAPRVSLTPIPAKSALQPTSGRQLLEQVVQRISQHQTISAKVRHRSNLFGQKLVGSGLYLQSRQADRVQSRFSLSVKMSDRMVTLLHVCNGRTLWMYDNLDGTDKLSRVDVLRLREAASDESALNMPILLGGGLPQMLGSLRADFIPSQPQSVVFQDVPVWAIALRWNPKRISKLLAISDLLDEKGNLRAEMLPEQVPDRVFLLVGQDDLFPYHVDFRRSNEADVLASMTGDKKTPSHSLTTMELFEVQFNAPVDPVSFAYRPGNVPMENLTEMYLGLIRRKNQASR